MQVVIGTAGHIDHGKTSLVEALTGTNTDNLDEEKSRGMTINLGFAYLNENITIIDVPGHEKFVRNMVAGVSTIDVALLVIAADDGIMPQTREHLQILLHLGIPKCVVALTKVDRVQDAEWIELVTLDIQQLLEESPFSDAPIIPTSTITGEGIDTVRNTLLKEAKSLKATLDTGIFRMPIDRVFHKKGFGVVVTGTVLSGALHTGNDLEVLPRKIKGKARGMQTHLAETDTIQIGDRAAINIAGVDAEHLWRGCELLSPGWIKPTQRLALQVNLLPDTRWKIKDKQRIRLHIGTAEVLGRAKLFGLKPLKHGDSAHLMLDLEKPISAAMDDKLILRSYSPMETIAGGTVLDTDLPQGKMLKSWIADLPETLIERFKHRVDFYRNDSQTVTVYSRIFHLPESEIKSMVESLGFIIEKELVLNPDAKAGNREKVLHYLEGFHQSKPYKKAVNMEMIQNKIDLSKGSLKMVLVDLVKEGRIKESLSGFALMNHEVKLSEEDRKKAEKISAFLKNEGYQLSKVIDVADRTNLDPKMVLELLHILKDEGLTDMVGDQFWIHSTSALSLSQSLQSFFKNHDSLDVNTFKELTGTTRKSAIPLLEFCDAKDWTHRDGNVRMKGRFS